MSEIAIILDKIDAHINLVLNQYMINVHHQMVNDLSAVITLVFGLYFGFYGVAVLRGFIETSPLDFFNHTLRFLLIAMFVYNANLMMDIGLGFFVSGPEEIANTIIMSVGNYTDSGSSIKSTMGVFVDHGFSIADEIAKNGTVLHYIISVALYIMVILLAGIPLATLASTEAGIIILLAIAPLFLIFLMFKNTRGLFEGWLRYLLYGAMMQILTYAVLMVSIALLTIGLEDHERMIRENIRMIDLLPFGIMSVVVLSLYRTVPKMAAIITSSMSLEGTRMGDLKQITSSAGGAAVAAGHHAKTTWNAIRNRGK